MRTAVLLPLLALATLGVAAAGLGLTLSGPVTGVRIAGEPLGPDAQVPAVVHARNARITGGTFTLHIEGSSEPLTSTVGALGVALRQDDIRRWATSIGRTGGLARRLSELWRARRSGWDVPLSYQLDSEVLFTRLHPIKEQLDEPPVAARWDFVREQVVPHQDGRYLDLDDTASRVLAAVRRGDRQVTVSLVTIPPTVNAEMVRRARFDRAVARYESHFSRSGDAANRAVNIETAAARLNGLVLAPNDVVSFNDVVGARTLDNGFRPSWEIYKGEMVRGIGGGTCQVSSTLFAAALYGGLDVVERYPHSRPSAYMGLGLDSTVAWPSVDLKLRNPWSFPVAIRAEVRGTRLQVHLFGAENPAKVDISLATLAVYPHKRKVTETAYLSEGTVIRKQKGINGYRVRRVRRVTPNDAPTREEVTFDVYPPTPEHYLVAPNTDLEDALGGDEDGSLIDQNPNVAPSTG